VGEIGEAKDRIGKGNADRTEADQGTDQETV
jgi:hypothetical protein